jgi:hypothetical protein
MDRAPVTPQLAILLGVALSACGSSGTGAVTGTGGAGGAPATPTCDAYCATIQAACTAGNQQYGDMGTCLLACPAFPASAGGDTTSDTLGCRLHYATMAATGATAAAASCTKAGPGGDGACGENCGGYCDLVMMYCTDEHSAKIYADRAACLADCATRGTDAKYTMGQNGGTSMGNQVACQLYHGVQASLFPGAHCLGDLAPTATTCRD